jgi:hypothetical protein
LRKAIGHAREHGFLLSRTYVLQSMQQSEV